MTRVKLIHWKQSEAEERAERIIRCGYDVDFETPSDYSAVKALKRDPPAAVVIDLGRLPSQGRDLALLLRQSKVTRQVPIVFVEGEPAKVEAIRKLVPDAVFCNWSRISPSLKRAIEKAPRRPAIPASGMAGYSGTPLPKKLGIKPGSTVALLNAPDNFSTTLGELPEGVTLKQTARGRRDLTIWFPPSLRELERQIDRLASQLEDGAGLWIAWPKQAAGVPTDVTQTMVRKIGLAAGLVDYKVCAIDATWSGLKFARRRS